MAVHTTEDAKTMVRVSSCDGWSDFTEAIRDPSPPAMAASATISSGALYRGQACCEWPLWSVWERHVDSNRARFEAMEVVGEGPVEGIATAVLHQWRTPLNAFAKIAASMPGVDLPGEGKENTWLALARHHGLVTPVLDWTESPFIAAFFACTDALIRRNPGLRGGVWSLEPDNIHGLTVRIVPPAEPFAVWRLYLGHQLFVEGEFEMFEPVVFPNTRQHAQRGMLTKLIHSHARSLNDYLIGRGLGYLLERIEVPGAAIGDALFDLEGMNITFASLFPDLDGAARHANWGNLWAALRQHPGFHRPPE